ncbi:MAG: PfkB family carbohydrate kinase [Fibrobacterales bacterium]
MSVPLLIVGLNPSWQRVMHVPSLIIGEVNRVTSVQEFPSGKGINCAMAARTWGAQVTLAHVLSGSKAGAITQFLTENAIGSLICSGEGEVRFCHSLISDVDSVTEIIEPGLTVTEQDMVAFADQLEMEVSRYAYVAFCGTYPQGTPDYLFDTLFKKMKECRVVLDGVKKVEPILKHGVWLLKINKDELLELVATDDVVVGWHRLQKKYTIEQIVVTDGSRSTWYCNGEELREYQQPVLDTVVNPIGAGDVFLGSLLAQITEGVSLHDAMAGSLGAAQVKCSYVTPWGWSRNEAIEWGTEITSQIMPCCDK